MKTPVPSKYYLSLFFLFPVIAFPQDTTVTIDKKVVTLTEVVVRNKLNVPGFIARVQNDTTFYKAFKTLRILGYTALNDIRMMDKNDVVKATLESRTRQKVTNGCRSMDVIEERTTGDIFDKERNWNYYTAQLYASLFFTTGTVCGGDNIVKGEGLNARNKTGMEKHKEQLKMLFFSPGTRIPGIPFIGYKIAIFDDDVSRLYDFVIDMDEYLGQACYVFKVQCRDDLTDSEKDQVVINNMTTWFNSSTMEIIARNYDLSYNAGVYDFNVHMEVQLGRFGEYLVPKLIRYSGNWHAIFKKREKGVFTATFFDFTR